MERPWLILRRVLRVDLQADEYAAARAHAHLAQAQAQAQHPAVAEAGEIDAQAHDEQHAAAAGEAPVKVDAAAVPVAPAVVVVAQDDEMNEAVVGEAEAEEEDLQQLLAAALEESVEAATNTTNIAESVAARGAAAAAPDITIEVAAPPGVTALVAGAGSQPDPDRPDTFPYIVAAGPFCLLVHFAVDAPSRGTVVVFDQQPEHSHSHLVVVRHFHRRRAQHRQRQRQVAARAVLVRSRPDGVFPALRSIDSVGLACDQDTGHYKIAELFVTTDAPEAEVVFMSSDTGRWYATFYENPLARQNTRRDWTPHGTLAIDTTFVWFDLSWGIISCDLGQPLDEQSLVFHRLPHGRVLRGPAPDDLHCRRCIAVSQNLVRFVEIEINPTRPAPTVNMWYRDLEVRRRRWNTNYSVSFEDIWADESYHQTGLPRTLPMLAGVSPVNSSVVYFCLEHRLFGVDVPHHRVVHCERHDPLIASPGPPDEPVTSRYLITWNLDADQEPNAGHEEDELSDHSDSSASGPVDEGELDYETPQE